MMRAVEIDPQFALAHKSLYFFGGREHRHKKNLQRAFELSGRLASDDRLIARGDYYPKDQGRLGKGHRILQRALGP